MVQFSLALEAHSSIHYLSGVFQATSWYGDLIAKRHSSFEGYRNSTISKWSEKTRLASGKINGKVCSLSLV